MMAEFRQIDHTQVAKIKAELKERKALPGSYAIAFRDGELTGRGSRTDELPYSGVTGLHDGYGRINVFAATGSDPAFILYDEAVFVLDE